MIPLQPETPKWLTRYVTDHKITGDVADGLCAWANQFEMYLEGRETERVYYRAIVGDTTEAIDEFGKLLHSVVVNARKQNDGTIRGYCRQRLLIDTTKGLQARVMTYLPEMIDDPRDIVRLKEVVKEFGWSRRVK